MIVDDVRTGRAHADEAELMEDEYDLPKMQVRLSKVPNTTARKTLTPAEKEMRRKAYRNRAREGKGSAGAQVANEEDTAAAGADDEGDDGTDEESSSSSEDDSDADGMQVDKQKSAFYVVISPNTSSRDEFYSSGSEKTNGTGETRDSQDTRETEGSRNEAGGSEEDKDAEGEDDSQEERDAVSKIIGFMITVLLTMQRLNLYGDCKAANRLHLVVNRRR